MRKTLKSLLRTGLVLSALSGSYDAQAIPYRVSPPNEPNTVVAQQAESETTKKSKKGGGIFILGCVALAYFSYITLFSSPSQNPYNSNHRRKPEHFPSHFA